MEIELFVLFLLHQTNSNTNELKIDKMSNTYAKIKTEDVIKGFNEFSGYTNNMTLTLTAFCGREKHTQLTIQTHSTLEHQSGTAYITLGDKEVDLLIAALLERKLGKVSAIGYEQSIFCPNDEEEFLERDE